MKEDQAWELKSKYVEKKYDNRVIARQEEEKKWNKKFQQRVADTWSPEKRKLWMGDKVSIVVFRREGWRHQHGDGEYH